MIPLLAQLGLALVAKKMQDSEANDAYKNAMRQNLSSTLADIKGMRAARAGDSGYMQRALGGSANMPRKQDSGSGAMLTQLGAALLSRRNLPDEDPEYGQYAQTKLRRSEF